MMEHPIPTAATRWIVGGDTGLSSIAIWAHMTGSGRPHWGYCYPLDPSDFGRCYRLLLAVPEWRPRIAEMAAHGEVWARMAAAWDELTALWDEESLGVEAPRLYGLLKHLERSTTTAPTGAEAYDAAD